MFTLEIGGKVVAVTDADEAQAREVFGSQDFKNDLLSIESEGRPLWDGVASFRVRPSSEEEIDALDETLRGEDDSEGTGEDDGINILFLVPVDNVDDGAAAS